MSTGLSDRTAVPTASDEDDGTPITGDELTALALAADTDQRLRPDAVPDPLLVRRGTLPLSYMPPADGGTLTTDKLRIAVAFVLIAAFLSITALGFCATYGPLAPA